MTVQYQFTNIILKMYEKLTNRLFLSYDFIMKSESMANTWITFIGVILLLIGIYGTTRTIVNLKVFEKYPQTGVLSLNLGGYGTTYYQREEECTYPRTYYTMDGLKVRPPTPQEKEQEKTDIRNCLTGVFEARQSAKINDISQSFLFLFLGIGVLVTRRIFFK